MGSTARRRGVDEPHSTMGCRVAPEAIAVEQAWTGHAPGSVAAAPANGTAGPAPREQAPPPRPAKGTRVLRVRGGRSLARDPPGRAGPFPDREFSRLPTPTRPTSSL